MVLPVSLLLLLVKLLLLLTAPIPTGVQDDDFRKKRERMVQENIAGRGIKNEQVLKAMRTVKRHLFVPASVVGQAYDDHPLPIGHNQTISQPYIVAYMTEVLNPKPGMRVLEVGTGSGYQAAVLAEIVKEVYTIEIVPEHGKAAAARLQKLGYQNVEVKVGDGYKGWPEHAPFDAIMVTAGAETVPPPLLEQLKEGGRMVIPVGPANNRQTLLLLEKKKGKIVSKELIPVIFVPFTREKEK